LGINDPTLAVWATAPNSIVGSNSCPSTKLLNWLLMHDEQLVTFEIDSDRDMMVSLKEVF